MLNNGYEIRGDVTAIFIHSKKYGTHETLIDTEDLEKVKQFPNTWFLLEKEPWSKVESFYVYGQLYSNYKTKKIRLHRLIMDASDGVFVDHINHDRQDNRKVNLRLATRSQNRQNLSGPLSNNTSGHLNVTWSKKDKRWIAVIKLNGKGIHLGSFVSKEDAAIAAQKGRAKYFDFSQEALREGGLT